MVLSRSKDAQIKKSNTIKRLHSSDHAFISKYRSGMDKNRGKPKTKEHRQRLSETRKRLFKEGLLSVKLSSNPAWEGGKSFETYGREFNDKLKETVRFRDGYKCQMCQMPQIENAEKLIVHHKDCDKKNNDFSNLISLCRNCHINLHWKIRKTEQLVRRE